MTIGQFKHRITLQKLVATTNENGFTEETYIKYKDVWSSITNLHGREYFQAAAVQKKKLLNS